MEDKKIIDFLDNDIDIDSAIDVIKKLFCLNTAYVQLKVCESTAYGSEKRYSISSIDDLYDWLISETDCADCKNGCQIYKDINDEYYYCITGANYYNEDNTYAGTNTVKIYMKPYEEW